MHQPAMLGWLVRKIPDFVSKSGILAQNTDFLLKIGYLGPQIPDLV